MKFNMAPENGWLEECFPFVMVAFQGKTGILTLITKLQKYQPFM